MIENYKGWDITLNWNDDNYLLTDATNKTPYNYQEKWTGVNLNGSRIYGSSLKEIRHIIDHPNLYK